MAGERRAQQVNLLEFLGVGSCGKLLEITLPGHTSNQTLVAYLGSGHVPLRDGDGIVRAWLGREPDGPLVVSGHNDKPPTVPVTVTGGEELLRLTGGGVELALAVKGAEWRVLLAAGKVNAACVTLALATDGHLYHLRGGVALTESASR